MSHSKIFGIGLAKTGTTSLNAALRILGYSTIDYPVGLKGVDEHDAATDMPIADKFEILDRRYPGSKFIYTVRNQDEWIKSCRKHWSKWHDVGRGTTPKVAEMLRRLYGTVHFDPDLFRAAYDRHEARVLNYFAARPDDLLIIDICSGRDGWTALCSFLGKEIPDRSFPHKNRMKSQLEISLERNRLAAKVWAKVLRKTRKKLLGVAHR